MTPRSHLVVVEAYDGMLEYLSDNAEERAGARGLGLPLADIAKRLDCRITILAWDEWLRYEGLAGTFFHWMPFPATRAESGPGPAPGLEWNDPRIRVRAIPARDPDHGEPFMGRGLSPLTHGLLADSDPLFLLSYGLHRALEAFLAEDPFDAVVLPMWGGAGYVAQMARATGASTLGEVGFITVATGTSARRHALNGEGLWTRPGITRRQMEDVSLALADLALAFGPLGHDIARDGRLADAAPPVLVPRRIPDDALECLTAAAASPSAAQGIELYLEEPQDAASGVLRAMDAVAELSRSGMPFARPFVSAGPRVKFAPMKPREFTSYWASRGFVRELVEAKHWVFRDHAGPDASVLPVRVYPSGFEHLPSIWGELGRGSCVLLSPAAAEGLVEASALPEELRVADEPGTGALAGALRRLLELPCGRVDQLRRELCARIAEELSGPKRREALDVACNALGRVLESRPAAQRLDGVARLFLARTTPLRRIDAKPTPVPAARDTVGTLSVVVACYNAGPLVAETLQSVWGSERMPDEVLLVDDGSDDPGTLETLQALQHSSAERKVPLTLIRQRNLGLAGARNTGLAAAAGEFISFIDADDLIEPEFYRVALDLARRNPGLGGVAAWAFCFGDGIPPGFWNAPQAELPLLLVENTVIVPCLTRTALLRELGGYDITQRYNYEDWELSVRLLAAGHPIVTIPRYLQRYRMRPESLWRTMSDVQNQGMRERMLSRHRETVSRFSLEVAMQIEHRLMQRMYAAGTAPVGVAARDFARSTRELFSSLIRRVRRRA